MPRSFVFFLFASSLALCGGTTCSYSTGDSKKDDDTRDGTEVTIVVDTRVSGGGGGNGAGPEAFGLVHAALQTSMLSPAALHPHAASPESTVEDGMQAGASPEHLASRGALRASRAPGAGSTIPEPAPTVLLLAGLGVLTWRLRRRPRQPSGPGIPGAQDSVLGRSR